MPALYWKLLVAALAIGVAATGGYVAGVNNGLRPCVPMPAAVSPADREWIRQFNRDAAAGRLKDSEVKKNWRQP